MSTEQSDIKRRFSERKVEGTFSELVEIIRILRRECPWDRAQKVQDIKFKLVEESYEAIDKFDKSDLDGFASEIGDVILVALFIVKIMEDEGKFDLKYVIRKLILKLIERHPHVFGDKKLDTAEAVLKNWEKMKGKTKKDDFNLYMPSLYLIYRIIEKLKSTYETDEKKIKEKLKKQIVELLVDGNLKNIPELIFKLAVLCSFEKINPEEEIRKRAISVLEGLDSNPENIYGNL